MARWIVKLSDGGTDVVETDATPQVNAHGDLVFVMPTWALNSSPGVLRGRQGYAAGAWRHFYVEWDRRDDC
jgi:hypothetical protein